MHGLNVRQALFVETNNRTPNSGDTMRAWQNWFTGDSPAIISQFLMEGETNFRREYWIKRLYTVQRWVNQSPYPVNVRNIYLRARKDIPTTPQWTTIPNMIVDIMETNLAVSPDQPFYSPLTSPELHKYFKIIKTTTGTLKPGKIYTKKMPCQKRFLNRAVTMEVEGNQNDFLLWKGSVVMVNQLYGTPCLNNFTPGTPSTIYDLTPFTVLHFEQYYASWYNMDDVTDNSYIGAGSFQWDAARDVQLRTQTPTPYQHAYLHVQGGPNNIPFSMWPVPIFTNDSNTTTVSTNPTLGTDAANRLFVTDQHP